MKKILKWTVAVLICAYVAMGLTAELFPQPQFTVEMAEAQNQVVTVYTYHDQGAAFPATLTGQDSYVCDIPEGYWKNAYHLEFTVDPANNRVLSAVINGKDAKPSQIVYPADLLARYWPYESTAIIRTAEITLKGVLVFGGIFLLLGMFCLAVRREVSISDFKTTGKALACGGSALKYIGKRAYIWMLIGVLVTFVLPVGNDIDGIIGTMNLSRGGISYYQYAATMDLRRYIDFPSFPYNLSLLLFYNLCTLPLALGKSYFAVGEYHVLHYLWYKILNGVLIFTTITCILSFLERHEYIPGSRCRSSLLWSFFNPLVFYVAVIFIQLDALPICCLTIGCLLLAEGQTPWLSGSLLGVGLTCKTQSLMLFPLVVILFLFVFIKEHKGKQLRENLKALVAWGIAAGAFLLPNLLKSAPVHVMLQFVPQKGRIWWTYIPYTADVFLYMTPAVLISVMIVDLLHLKTYDSKNVAAINVLYMFAAVVLLFSCSILATPSTYIITLAAFTLCNALTGDNLHRALLNGMSLFMTVEQQLNEVSPFKLLNRLGWPGNFTTVIQTITENGIPYVSLIFTISHVSMAVFGIYFCKIAVSMLHAGDVSGGNYSVGDNVPSLR